jgi:hypothetical protein
MTAATPTATVSAAAAPLDRQVWRSGNARRLTMAFAFLILLPFWASLGPMLLQRVSRGFLVDTIALSVFALAFTALMALLLQQLIHAVRTRIEVSPSGVSLTVPRVGPRGPFFLWRYVTASIPFNEIAAIDRRTEVYGGAMLPLLLTSLRVVPKNGEPVVLGYTNAHEQDEQFPYDLIAQRIAARSGVPITDHGMVRRSLQKRALGLKSESREQLPVAEIEALNIAHQRNIRGLVLGLGILLLAGIAIDFLTASRTTYAEMGAGLSSPSRGTKDDVKRK